MESGIIFGLPAALYGEIKLAGGAVEQSNFPDYEMIKLETAPRFETVLLPQGTNPGSIGKIGPSPLAPVVANAVFAATGKRLRRLPLSLDA